MPFHHRLNNPIPSLANNIVGDFIRAAQDPRSGLQGPFIPFGFEMELRKLFPFLDFLGQQSNSLFPEGDPFPRVVPSRPPGPPLPEQLRPFEFQPFIDQAPLLGRGFVTEV